MMEIWVCFFVNNSIKKKAIGKQTEKIQYVSVSSTSLPRSYYEDAFSKIDKLYKYEMIPVLLQKTF